MCTPSPLGLTSVYELRVAITSCAHGSMTPVAGWRQWSRSTPHRPSENMTPMPL